MILSYIGVFILGMLVIIIRHKYTYCTCKTKAIIVATPGILFHRPVYQYLWEDTLVTCRSRVSSPHKMGDRVVIFINPNNPKEMCNPLDHSRYYYFLIMAVAYGLVCFTFYL